jgi:hypothetical protein
MTFELNFTCCQLKRINHGPLDFFFQSHGSYLCIKAKKCPSLSLLAEAQPSHFV